MKIKKEYKDSIIATLKCYKLLPARIDELNKRLKELDLNDGVRGIDYSGDGIKTNNINKIVEDTALSNILDKIEINKELLEVKIKLERLDSAVNSLDSISSKIIMMKYVEGASWNEVVDVVNYTDRTCRTKIGAALGQLAYIFYGSRVFIKDISEIV